MALRWVGEQYGARLDVLGVLLGRLGGLDGPLSLWGVRNQVARWEDLKLARAEKLPGGVWVTLTRLGLDRAGLGEFRLWRIPLSRSKHSHAVNITRLAYEWDVGRAERAPWVSERMTWAERGNMTWHVPDGVIRRQEDDGTASSTGVEVELTLKPTWRYAEDVFGKLRRGPLGIDRVQYLVQDQRFREQLIERLSPVAGDGCGPVGWSVDLLPSVPGVAYMDRW